MSGLGDVRVSGQYSSCVYIPFELLILLGLYTTYMAKMWNSTAVVLDVLREILCRATAVKFFNSDAA